jgi:predicted transcriptional regulator
MKKQIFVGGTLKDAAARVVDAARLANQDEAIEPQDNVTFLTWSALAAVMTDKRHDLLRHLHRHPAPSIRALARDLGRDFKRVHQDVTALEMAGLLERDDTGLHADYGRIQAIILLGADAA